MLSKCLRCVCVLLCPTAVLKALDLPDLGKSRSSPPDFHFLQVCNVPLLERDTNASDATVRVSRCRWGLGSGFGARTCQESPVSVTLS